MVKPFFDLENWETNAFKSRKYSTYPVFITKFKGCNYKMV